MTAVSNAVLAEARERGVYFFLPFPEANIHASVCVAQGLAELGVPVFANANAYPQAELPGQPDLFTQSPRHPNEAAFVLVDMGAIDDRLDSAAPYQVLRQLRCRGAALCIADRSTEMAAFADDIPTFLAHNSRFVRPTGRLIPWAFGLSREMIARIDAARASAPARRRCMVRDFRPSFSQSVRQALDLALVKPLARRIEIDDRIDGIGRFQDAHYARLAAALGCLAYGGTFTEDFAKNAWFREQGHTGPRYSGDGPFVVRWDSWRLWESLAAGCATVTLDFEEYGMVLPVMPEKRVHYVDLQFDRLGEAIDFIVGDDERLQRIGEAGRRWVLEHYAPKPVALRLLAALASAYGVAG